MAGTRQQINKAHKSRFASKSSRNVHKVSLQDRHKNVKSERHVGKGARAARVQRNKMLRDQRRADVLKQKRASSGSGSPPRVIVLFGLSSNVDLNSLEEDLSRLLSAEGNGVGFPAVASSEYKLRTTILKAPYGDLLACMELAKVADLLAFVASTRSLDSEDNSSDYIDSFGSYCLSVFRALGLPSTAVLIRDLPTELKKKNDLKKSCTSSLASEFPEDCKFYPADTKDDLHKFLWIFKEHRLTLPHWRQQRPYLMAQKVDFVADENTSGKCTLILTGYLRAHTLSVNQLVHVSGAGDYQLSKLELLKDPCPLNIRKGEDIMDSDDANNIQVQIEICGVINWHVLIGVPRSMEEDNLIKFFLVIRSLSPDPVKQEPLLVENIPDPLAGEQTWPTEEEMADADGKIQDRKLHKKILPPGTSDYQAAWIVDGSDVDSTDTEENEDDGMVLDDRESEFQGVKDGFEPDDDMTSLPREYDDVTETESVMMEGENMTREQVEEEIRKIKAEHAEDEEFPDEVDTPFDVPARKRFAKYRGLMSLRASSWDPKESLPPEYARIFAFDNFKRTQKHVLAKALDIDQGNVEDCVPAGSYARLHIKDVPDAVASRLDDLSKTMPVISCGLLQHESKISVLHFSIRKHDTYTAPLKAKEELTFHVGFRQFMARPLYSSDTMNSDKHKMEKFLHAGRFSIASVFAPISFPPLPLIALKNMGEAASPVVAAVGSLKSIDPDRIILKKIILTGYPLRVSKLKATVRYMFHTPEDVRWFKPVEVWTKCGRRGRVKEPVGTHGAMKCVFNGVLQQHDTVCMSLYKRAYPKWPDHWYPQGA